jgi:hypothetical protein
VQYRIGSEGLLTIVDGAGSFYGPANPLGYRAADLLPIDGSNDCSREPDVTTITRDQLHVSYPALLATALLAIV